MLCDRGYIILSWPVGKYRELLSHLRRRGPWRGHHTLKFYDKVFDVMG